MPPGKGDPAQPAREDIMMRLLTICLLAGALATPAAMAADYVATVKTVEGRVEVERGGDRLPAAPGFRIAEKDVVHTGPEATAGLTFTDNSLIALGPSSSFAVAGYSFNPTTNEGAFRSRLERGSLSARSGRLAKRGRDQMLVETPHTVLAVRGTRFLMRVAD
jgi:hypothetical protein